MRVNHSMPSCTIVPELAYPDVAEAIAWLCNVYGFKLRLRVANHRAHLTKGDGCVVLTTLPENEGSDPTAGMGSTHAVMVRVTDIDAHYAWALRHGAVILKELGDYAYGERQYTTQDFAGHTWTFSQTIADVTPEDWGGTSS